MYMDCFFVLSFQDAKNILVAFDEEPGFWSVPDDRHDNITMEIINGWGSLEWTIEDPPVEARFACVTIESYNVQTGNTMMHLVLFSMIFCKTFRFKICFRNLQC